MVQALTEGESRAKRIRMAAAAVEQLSRAPGGLRVLRAMRALPPARHLQTALLGYRRPFQTLAEAQSAIGPGEGGHEGTANIDWHLGMEHDIRPSDYAVLFHLRPLLSSLDRVFDLGGSVGNLFYSYSRYLPMPPGLRWQVFDLPAVIARGAAVAAERGACQLCFTSRWEDADGADLLIASGSMHYFEEPLSAMIAGLPSKPRFVMINRSPLTEGPPVATVQDSVGVRVACVLHSRANLVSSFAEAGYELIDQWRAPELALTIPGYPEHSAPSYSGMFFQRQA